MPANTMTTNTPWRQRPRRTRYSNGALCFLDSGQLVVQFETDHPRSYGSLLHAWRNGTLTQEELLTRVLAICRGVITTTHTSHAS